MAGVVGLDWRDFTFAEMRRMWLSRSKHDSRLAARVQWAMYAFGGMGGKKKRLEPRDFDPYAAEERKRGIPLNKQTIAAIGKGLKKGVHRGLKVRRPA